MEDRIKGGQEDRIKRGQESLRSGGQVEGEKETKKIRRSEDKRTG